MSEALCLQGLGRPSSCRWEETALLPGTENKGMKQQELDEVAPRTFSKGSAVQWQQDRTWFLVHSPAPYQRPNDVVNESVARWRKMPQK